MPSKYCHKCETQKSVDRFYRNRTKKDGLSTNCKECNKEYGYRYRKKHPDKVLAIQKKVYRRRYANPQIRRTILDKNNEYNKKHRQRICERARKRKYIKAGLPIKRKTFAFYRDVIVHWMNNPIEAAPKWKLLLSLPLTPRQRQIAEMTQSGLGVLEISKILQRQQCTITKAWNGVFNYEKNKCYGGIYNIVRKYMPQLMEPEYEQFCRLQTLTFRRNNEKVFSTEPVSMAVDGD